MFARRLTVNTPDTGALTCAKIDARSNRAVFLYDLERATGRGNLARAKSEILNQGDLPTGETREQRGFVIGEANFRGVETVDARSDAVAPTGEIRQVMGQEVGECAHALGGSRRIENNLKKSKKGIVLNNDNGTGRRAHWLILRRP